MNKFVIAAIAASLSYPAFAQSGTTTPTMPPDQQRSSPGMQDDRGSPTRSQREMWTPSDSRSPSDTRRRSSQDGMSGATTGGSSRSGRPGTPSSESQSPSETERGKMQSGAGQERSQSNGASTVRQVQQALDDKGYSPGPVDGIVGTKTQSALRDFQQSQGLPATGGIDSQTLSALGVSNNGADRPKTGGTSATPQSRRDAPPASGSGSRM